MGVLQNIHEFRVRYASVTELTRVIKVICVKIRPRKACRYPNMRSFGWVSHEKVGGLYSGKLGIRSEARASDLRSHPGLWWKRIKLHLYEGTKVSTLRGLAQLADLQGALCVPTFNLTYARASGICGTVVQNFQKFRVRL